MVPVRTIVLGKVTPWASVCNLCLRYAGLRIGKQPAAPTLSADYDPEAVWKTATTAYQSVAEPKVALASCAPAALTSTSWRSTDPELVWLRIVNDWPCDDPGVTDPGDPPVMMPPMTSSPAPTAAVGPESTATLLPFGTAT